MFDITGKQLFLLYPFYVGLVFLIYLIKGTMPNIYDLLGYGGALWGAYVAGTAFLHTFREKS
ncbi:MAG TPA: hypothetical protein VMV86_01175 [Methanosarcinales archaeon]|nr:hypothetical protein [Methanosarcinales archaeon]